MMASESDKDDKFTLLDVVHTSTFPQSQAQPYISFILIHKIPDPCVVTLVARIGPSQNYDAYIFVNRRGPFHNFTFYSENQGQN